MKEQIKSAAVLKHSLRLLPLLGLSTFLSGAPSLRADAPTPLPTTVKSAEDRDEDARKASLLHAGLSGSVPLFSGTPDGLRAGEPWMRDGLPLETPISQLLETWSQRTKAKQAAGQPYERSFFGALGEMFDKVNQQIEERKQAILEANRSRYLAAKAAATPQDAADDRQDAVSVAVRALAASMVTAPVESTPAPVAGGSEARLFQVDTVLARIGDEYPTYGGTLTTSNSYSSPGNTAITWYGLPDGNDHAALSSEGTSFVTKPVYPSTTPVWNYTPVATVGLPAPQGATIQFGAPQAPQAAAATLTLASPPVLTSSSSPTFRTSSMAGAGSSGGSLTLAVASVPAGPTSTLYLSAGDQHTNFRLPAHTTTAISSPQTGSNNEYALAISGGVIRSGGNGQFGAPNVGSTYDLNFNNTGPQLGNPGNNVLDGSTNGVVNFGLNWQTGAVYRYNLDWTSPVLLFTASMSGAGFGLTYSPANNSLWVSDSGGKFADYSMTGTLLSSFTYNGSEGRALAYDPADGTLWAMTNSGLGTLTQFNTSGTVLQTFNTNTSGNSIFGGEFAEIPEPTGATLLGLGFLAVAASRRRAKAALAAVPVE